MENRSCSYKFKFHDGNSFAKYRDICNIVNILVGTTAEFLSGNGIPSQKCPRARSRTIKFGLNVRTHGTAEDNCLHVDYTLTRNETGVAGVCGGEKSSSFYSLTGLYRRVLFASHDNTLS